MAKLTAAQRKKIPKSEFGLPDKKAYPMPDKSHAANAKARAEQQVRKGRMSEATEEKIDAKANRVIRAGGGRPGRDDTGKARPMTSASQRNRIEARRSAGITVGRQRRGT